jgi:AbrB family looped-hinge helix DNA binding protein
MQSTITSKFQTTIPKAVRENLALAVNDTLEWKVDHGKVIVSPRQKNFLQYQNRIKIGKGDIKADILLARERRREKYR